MSMIDGLPQPDWQSDCGTVALYCADCLDILPQLPDGCVDMCWTDPPYGHKNHDGDWNARLNKHRGLENKPIANDSPDSMRDVVDAVLNEASRVLSPDCCCCCCCCCGGGGPRPTFAWLAQRMDRLGLDFFHSVIWDKRNPGLGWRYRRQHEMVMVAHRTGGKLLWNRDAKAQRNIISVPKPRGGDHPNEKPVALVETFVNNHAPVSSTILDPFLGSGTTAVACINTGRKCIGIEKEPKYFDIAVERCKKALADKAELLPIEQSA